MDMEDKQYVFGSIFLLANKLQIIGDRELEELSFKQWFLLVAISNIQKAQPSLTDIANFVGVSRQNVKKMLVILERKDFVMLNTLPGDNKSIRVTLTAKCKTYFKEFDESRNEVLEKIFRNINYDEIQTVLKAFTTMFENIDDVLKKNR
jgi:DNA-binding MarR family transcriptional regulator